MKLKVFYIAILFLCVAFTSNAKSVHNDKIMVDVNKLEQQGNNLLLNMKLNIGPKAIPSRRSLTLTPVLVAGTNRFEFPVLVLNGKNRQKIFNRAEDLNNYTDNGQVYSVIEVNKRNTIAVDYNVTVSFRPWMEQAHLDLEENLCACDGYTEVFASNLLVPSVTMDFVPHEIAPVISIIVPNVETVKNRNESGTAYLDFEVGRSVILPKFRNNAGELKKIHQMIGSIKDDTNTTIKQIVIQGYASPEGPAVLNEKLSKNRSEALSIFLKSHYGLNNIPVKVEWFGEDWAGLKKAIEQSSVAQKAVILDIINGNVNADTKDQRLKSLSGGSIYKELLRTYYPPLRRSDYRIDYVVNAFTVEEGIVVLSTRPQQLSLNEMYLIANTYPKGSDKFNNVFDVAVLMFPEDAVANINAAGIAIDKADYPKAHRYLKKVEKDARAWNNLGILYMREGNLDSAEACFIKAKNNGDKDAAGNLKQLTFLRENLEKAGL